MTVLLAGAEILDVESGSMERADVLLQGDRIAAVGPGLSGDEQVDCSGGTLIPGLIDCHAHVAFPSGEPLPRSARILEAVAVLYDLLTRGVTTVRDAWGADAGFPHALSAGWIRGPDLLISVGQLSPTGGLGDDWSPEYGDADAFADPSLPDPLFDGTDSARAAVRRMVRAGADWIKMGANSPLSSIRRGRDITPTDDEIHALVDEARRCGRDVFAHAHTPDSATAAAQAGVRSIEHGVFLDEHAIAAMHRHRCWYVPTLAGIRSEGDEASDAAHRRSVQLALATGVPIAAGSDMSTRPQVDVLDELPLLSEAGLGDAGALRAATSEAARLLRLDHDRGCVAPGLRADLVLLDGSGLSLEDLPGRIRTVWQNGRPVTASHAGSGR
ncbi:amidohydrolase family protein [Streptomyces sp. NPDC048254]|uniref:amidohydrolase family protein n=1 Tax=Streptomyces sp. NPDC048254 TaxID=3365525 RepID=UPI0037156657